MFKRMEVRFFAIPSLQRQNVAAIFSTVIFIINIRKILFFVFIHVLLMQKPTALSAQDYFDSYMEGSMSPKPIEIHYFTSITNLTKSPIQDSVTNLKVNVEGEAQFVLLYVLKQAPECNTR